MKKCVCCNFELDDAAKFCPECGAKQEARCPSCSAVLKPGARFCSECGTKIINDSSALKVSAREVERIDIDASATGLGECELRITNIQAEGPNVDNQYKITVNYEITNKSTVDWAFLHTTIQIFSGSGKIIDQATDKSEDLVEIGGVKSKYETFWSIDGSLFDTSIEKMHAVIVVTASELIQQRIDIHSLPSDIAKPEYFDCVEISRKVRTISGYIIRNRGEEDSDDDQVELKLSVQSISPAYLPFIYARMNITNMNDEQLAEIQGNVEILPGDMRIISMTGYISREEWNTAKIKSMLCVLEPVASGLRQIKGCELTVPDSTIDDTGANVEVRRYLYKGRLAIAIARLSRIESKDVLSEEPDEIIRSLSSYESLRHILEKDICELSAFWDIDSQIVSEMEVVKVRSTYILSGQLPSLKNVEVDFIFMVNEDGVEDEDSIISDIGAGLILTVSTNGVKFEFSDSEEIDISINVLEVNRYIRASEGGEFLASIAYIQELDSEGQVNFLGAYYGYIGSGDYDGGFFRINEAKNTHDLLNYDDVESSESKVYFNKLLSIAAGFCDDDEQSQCSQEAINLLSESSATIGDRVYADDEFDGDILHKVSNSWELQIKFERPVSNNKHSDDDRNDLLAHSQKPNTVFGAIKGDEVSNGEHKIDHLRLAMDKFEAIADSLMTAAMNAKFHIKPRIPEKKLKGAISSYAQDVEAADVLMLFDSTVFGGGAEGVLITKTKIYAKDLGSTGKCLKLSEINTIVYKHSMFNPCIWINDNQFVQMNNAEKGPMSEFVEYIQKWADIMKFEKNSPD